MRVTRDYYESKNKIILFATLGVISSILFGLLLGYWSFSPSEADLTPTNGKSDADAYYKSLIQDDEDDALFVLRKIGDDVDVENIRRHLKYFTSIPHIAGSDNDKATAEYIGNEWKTQGLDAVKIIDYDVLLDYSDDIKFNNIEIRDASNELEETHEIKETIYDTNLDYTHISKPFLALGTNGSITTDEVYYANHCDVSDFEMLLSKSMSVKDKIVLCRYGSIFRGNKVMNGQIYGAKAVIIFDDPIRAAPSDATNEVYPNGQFLPPDGVQRGSIYLKEGDPLTPIYPSIESAYRIKINESKYLLKIPGQVIGYGLAEKILKLVDNNDPNNLVPQKWRGIMKTNYTFGGKLKNNRKFTLNVYNKRRVAKVHDVVGIIEGSVEPDRYVMVGNHRDAWTFGSVDPNVGTSSVLEISRVLMSLKKQKLWTPKRSILFLSWSAEEYGSQGSTEWVEEHLSKLTSNGVVYINLDNILKGNFSLQVKASPLTFDLLYELTKRIKVNETTTVFERWIENESIENGRLPKISPYMGSGSDHLAFLQRAGIPCIDQRFIRDNKDPLFLHMIGSFPLYHSSYETYNLVHKFLDPDFKITRVMTLVAAETIRSLSSPLILPFNCVTYTKQIQKELDKFFSKYKPKLDALKISVDQLKKSVDDLVIAAIKFQNRLNSLDKTKYHLVRQYNDQLKNLERAFLDPSTLEQNGYMHMLFAPSSFNKYGAYSFPTLIESIYLYEKNKSSNELVEKIKFKLSIVIYTIRSAIQILKEPIDFDRNV